MVTFLEDNEVVAQRRCGERAVYMQWYSETGPVSRFLNKMPVPPGATGGDFSPECADDAKADSPYVPAKEVQGNKAPQNGSADIQRAHGWPSKPS